MTLGGTYLIYASFSILIKKKKKRGVTRQIVDPGVATRFNEIVHLKSLAQHLAMHYLITSTVLILSACEGRGRQGKCGQGILGNYKFSIGIFKIKFWFHSHNIIIEVKSTWCPRVSTCTKRYRAVMERWTNM